jgi:hypothetical protein
MRFFVKDLFAVLVVAQDRTVEEFIESRLAQVSEK